MTSRTTRWVKAAVVAGTATLALSGCMRMHMDLTVTEDDTLEGSIIMGVEDATITMLGEDPQEVWEMAKTDLTADLPSNMTEEPYAENGYTGSRITFDDAALDEFGGTDGFDIERNGDVFEVTGSMDLTAEELDTEEIPASIAGTVDVQVSITFPGDVIEADGEIDGKTVTWTPKYGEVTEFNAEAYASPEGAAATQEPTQEPTDTATTSGSTTPTTSSNASSGFPFWIIWVAVGLIAVAGIVLVIVLVTRNNKKQAVGGAPQYGATPQYPGQPYPGQPAQPQYGAQPAGPQAYPGQPPYPGQPGQQAPQQYPGQPGQQPPQAPGQQYPGQAPYPGQPGQQPPQAPGQQYPGQQYPGQ